MRSLKKFLGAVSLLWLLAGATAFAQNECGAAGLIPLTSLNSRSTNGVIHQTACWDATNSTLTFPLTPGTGVAWGAITGTLSNQTDLQNALNLKAPLANPTFTGVVSLGEIENGTAGIIVGANSLGAVTVGGGVGFSFLAQDSGNGESIAVGPYISGTGATADTFGIGLVGAAGSEIFVDCTDAGCGTSFFGVNITAPNGNIILNPKSGGNVTQSQGATILANLQKPTQIGAQATSGTFGMPVVVAQSTLTGRTTALTTTTLFTVGAATGTFGIEVIINCDTSVSTATATATATYTDASNTSIVTTGSGALCTTLGTASHQLIDLPHIRAKNGTVISWAVAIANSPNYDASATVLRYQ